MSNVNDFEHRSEDEILNSIMNLSATFIHLHRAVYQKTGYFRRFCLLMNSASRSRITCWRRITVAELLSAQTCRQSVRKHGLSSNRKRDGKAPLVRPRIPRRSPPQWKARTHLTLSECGWFIPASTMPISSRLLPHTSANNSLLVLAAEKEENSLSSLKQEDSAKSLDSLALLLSLSLPEALLIR